MCSGGGGGMELRERVVGLAWSGKVDRSFGDRSSRREEGHTSK